MFFSIEMQVPFRPENVERCFQPVPRVCMDTRMRRGLDVVIRRHKSTALHSWHTRDLSGDKAQIPNTQEYPQYPR